MRLPNKSSVFRTAVLGVLCALAVALSFLESVLPPLPIPGAKWGLSNLATMTALSLFGFPSALAVTVIKAGFAFFRGGAAGWMSLCGGLLSILVMGWLFRWRDRIFSLWGISVAGAIAHNAGQLLAATLLFSPSLIHYAPWLWLAGLVTGSITGLVVRVVFPVLQRHIS